MKDWKYILYLTLAFGLFIAVKLSAPKEHDWTITLAHDDKNPYGAYVMGELLPAIFPGKKIDHYYKTFYEIKDSVDTKKNIVTLASTFSGAKEDTNALLDHIHNGGTAFISAQNFYGVFADTLKLNTQDYIFKDGGILFNQNDSATIQFVNANVDTKEKYIYRRDNIHNYFSRFDTTRTTVIAKNDQNMPVTIRVAWGKGNLILNSTPLAFSNIYLLSGNNDQFVSTTLSYLPVEDVVWTEYYHLGRMESQSPLRFILTSEPLRWAYYLTVLSILIFMIFEAKRKQRIIPIVKPLENTTLEFVGTVGNLYYQHGDHKNLAEKKILFFLEQIRVRYNISTQRLDEPFILMLSKRSGHEEQFVRLLMNTIKAIQAKKVITAEELIDLNKKIQKFNLTLM